MVRAPRRRPRPVLRNRRRRRCPGVDCRLVVVPRRRLLPGRGRFSVRDEPGAFCRSLRCRQRLRGRRTHRLTRTEPSLRGRLLQRARCGPHPLVEPVLGQRTGPNEDAWDRLRRPGGRGGWLGDRRGCPHRPSSRHRCRRPEPRVARSDLCPRMGEVAPGLRTVVRLRAHPLELERPSCRLRLSTCPRHDQRPRLRTREVRVDA